MSQFSGVYLVTDKNETIVRWEFPIVPSIGSHVEIGNFTERYEVESVRYVIGANESKVLVFLKRN